QFFDLARRAITKLRSVEKMLELKNPKDGIFGRPPIGGPTRGSNGATRTMAKQKRASSQTPAMVVKTNLAEARVIRTESRLP
ncbi:MAG: hypothetical protein ACYDGM_13960, partial [Vulcanimicrobiaceae bacterium]